MSTWTEGYVSEVNYTTGYYKELNPQNLIAPLLMAGIAPPNIENACELGFGMGVSFGIHAAAGKAKWYGTDFNPSHALFANYLNRDTACEKFELADQSFSEFCCRDDLPDFDFIALHGIWSWISKENQEIIVDFVRRKLKIGGVLYISYNTMPGWSAAAPLQHLISRSYEAFANPRNTPTQNIEQAVEYTASIIAKSHGLTQSAPIVQEHMQKIQQFSKNRPSYVLHEYLNQQWEPMYFAEMEEHMTNAKLNYACSSNYLNDCDFATFSDEVKPFLAQVTDPSLKQTIKDFLLNTPFRRDLWVKGKLTLNKTQLEQEWFKQRVIMACNIDNVQKSDRYIMPFTLNQEYLDALLKVLSDYRIHSVESICQTLGSDFDNTLIFQLIAILIDKNHLVLAHSDEQITKAKKDCANFNQKVFDMIFEDNAFTILASPVTGGGIGLSEIDLLFAHAYHQGLDEESWVDYAISRLGKANKAILKEGKAIETREEMLKELQSMQTKFKNDILNTLLNLGIL